jgi:hypothetical protein
MPARSAGIRHVFIAAVHPFVDIPADIYLPLTPGAFPAGVVYRCAAAVATVVDRLAIDDRGLRLVVVLRRTAVTRRCIHRPPIHFVPGPNLHVTILDTRHRPVVGAVGRARAIAKLHACPQSDATRGVVPVGTSRRRNEKQNSEDRHSTHKYNATSHHNLPSKFPGHDLSAQCEQFYL